MLSDKSGFSLIELVVAITIMGISFAVLTSGFGVNIRSLSVSDGYNTANALLRRLYTETEYAKNLTTGSDEGNFGDDYPEFTFKRSVSREGENLYLTAHLEVLFTRLGGERSVSADVVLPLPEKPQSELN